MKFNRLALLSLVSVALLAGCGKSSSPTSATPQSLDTTPPPAPEALSTTVEASNQYLIWNASGAPDVVGYEIFAYAPSPTRTESYVFVDYTAEPRWSLTGVGLTATSFYRVRAVDEAGNRSAFTSTLQVEALPSQDLPSPDPSAPPKHQQNIE